MAASPRPAPSPHHASPGRADRRLWLVALACGLMMMGYFGPWVPHPAAGLVVTGLDLAEYVKFLPAFSAGQLSIVREAFYAPLVAVSVTLSLIAFRLPVRPRWLRWLRWLLRLLVVLLAIVAALNLLPPAWSPPLLRTPEFRLQSMVLLACVGLALLSPLLALLPRRLSALLVVVLAAPATWLPTTQFLQVRPHIADLYAKALPLGWGFWLCAAGSLLLLAAALYWLLSPSNNNI